jgi:hypothetical protein
MNRFEHSLVPRAGGKLNQGQQQFRPPDALCVLPAQSVRDLSVARSGSRAESDNGLNLDPAGRAKSETAANLICRCF